MADAKFLTAVLYAGTPDQQMVYVFDCYPIGVAEWCTIADEAWGENTRETPKRNLSSGRLQDHDLNDIGPDSRFDKERA